MKVNGTATVLEVAAESCYSGRALDVIMVIDRNCAYFVIEVSRDSTSLTTSGRKQLASRTLSPCLSFVAKAPYRSKWRLDGDETKLSTRSRTSCGVAMSKSMAGEGKAELFCSSVAASKSKTNSESSSSHGSSGNSPSLSTAAGGGGAEDSTFGGPSSEIETSWPITEEGEKKEIQLHGEGRRVGYNVPDLPLKVQLS